MHIVRVGVDTPRVEYERGNRVLPAKKRGILAAMVKAVESAEPGTLIIQEDVELEADDLGLVGDVPAGTIACLNPRLSPMHTCPRAFIVSDDATKRRLLKAWKRTTVQSCYSWADILKVYPEVRGTHRGEPWR